MRPIKIIVIVLILIAIINASKNKDKPEIASKGQLDGAISSLVKRENNNLPLTIMFNQREGIVIEHVEAGYNVINYSMNALGRFDEGEINKSKVEKAALEIYCDKSWDQARDAGVNVVFILKSQLIGLNDKKTQTQMRFTPRHCTNLALAKKLNSK